MEKPAAALRKRQQIGRANRSMFLVIAGVSVVVGFSLVLIIFLGQRIWFGQRVIEAKNKTISVLQKNLDTVGSLKQNILVLNTNQDLQSIQLSDSAPAVQTVLDALPSEANSTAMASSLQTKLLNNVPGVSLDSLKVDPVSGVEIASDGSTQANSSNAGSNTIGFSFSVSAASTNQDGLRQILLNIEKSIRPFKVTNLSVESQGSRIVMNVTGLGYYEPAQTVHLTDEVVKP